MTTISFLNNTAPTTEDSVYFNGTNWVNWIRRATIQKVETTAADANVLTLTPPTVASSWFIIVSCTTTTGTSTTCAFQISYTDAQGSASGNVQIAIARDTSAATLTTAASATAASARFGGSLPIDVDNSGGNIVVKWVGGGAAGGGAKVTASILHLAGVTT
jgi:hypothetical protein